MPGWHASGFCVGMHVCVCAHTHAHTSAHVCVRARTCVCVPACVRVCMHVCVFPPARPLAASGVTWCDIDPVCLVKQVLGSLSVSL